MITAVSNLRYVPHTFKQNISTTYAAKANLSPTTRGRKALEDATRAVRIAHCR